MSGANQLSIVKSCDTSHRNQYFSLEYICNITTLTPFDIGYFPVNKNLISQTHNYRIDKSKVAASETNFKIKNTGTLMKDWAYKIFLANLANLGQKIFHIMALVLTPFLNKSPVWSKGRVLAFWSKGP